MTVNIIPYCPTTGVAKKGARLARSRATRNARASLSSIAPTLSPEAVIMGTDMLNSDGLVSMDDSEATTSGSDGCTPVNVTFAPITTAATVQSSLAVVGQGQTFQDSLDALDTAAHQIRMDLAAGQQSDGATGKTYGRHINNYFAWWETYQAELSRLDPGRVPLPAEPITAGKALMFINSERTRKKRKGGSGEEVEGSALGRYAISQVISALEWRRKDRLHLYRKDADPDIRLSLRDDERIRQIESVVKHDEPKRIAKAQALKAAGTSADTYTEAQLFTIAKHFLNVTSGSSKLAVEIRDRAMILTAACTAFRGDSQRILLWSDLFLKDVPIQEIAVGRKITALAVLADNAKHNQYGRVDEFGAIRHRHSELCAIGALALHFFAYFHILNKPVPTFEPDFTNKEYGEYGCRPWYTSHVFPGKTLDSEMSYENHRTRILVAHQHADIVITKVTHAGRVFAGSSTRSHGSSVDDTKALGGWNEHSGVFRSCYDRALPLPALLGAAMFNGRDPATYNLPRDVLDPPLSVVLKIFPWIDAEERALNARQSANPHARDLALTQLFKVMKWFRHVLVQDMAILYSDYPHALIFTFSPFDSAAFRKFAAGAKALINLAEENARLHLKHLPENLVRGVQGAMTNLDLKLEQDREASTARLQVLEDNINGLKDMLSDIIANPSTRKRRRISESPALSHSASPTPTPPTQLAVGQRLYTPPVLVPLLSSPVADNNGLMPLDSFVRPSTTPFVSFDRSPSILSPPHNPFPPSIPSIAHSNVTIYMSSSSTSPQLPMLRTQLDSGQSTDIVQEPVAVAATSSSPGETVLGVHATLQDTSISPALNVDPPKGHPNDPQAVARWAALVNAHQGVNLLRHPTWTYSNGEWIPVYEYQRANTIMDIWDEWIDGRAPYLAVRFMTDVWGAKWRFNDRGLKTEAWRRAKVVNLVLKLQQKPGWDVALVRRFFIEKYASFTARKFCDYLVKNTDSVFVAANAYP